MRSCGDVLVVAFGEKREQCERPTSNADGADKGIIPLTCSELFVRVGDKKAADPNINFTVEVSYIEVRHVMLLNCTHSDLPPDI